MNIQDILSEEDVALQVSQLMVRPFNMPSGVLQTLKDQYEPESHRVFDKTYRPDKIGRRPSGQKDDKGDDIMESYTILVSRIAFPFQKTICKRAASFLFGSDVTFDYDTQKDQSMNKVIEMITKILKSNRSTSINKELARRLFSEMEVAEYWYPVKDDRYWGSISKSKFRLRCKLFSPFLGDRLFPHFDDFGDMDAFSRHYFILEDQKNVEYLDLFTRTAVYRYKMSEQGWQKVTFKVTDPETGNVTEVDKAPNLAGRIPIVYYYQKETDWSDVQPLIERFEDTVSNFADTNDYFGRPILTVNGDVLSMPDKGESGKLIQMEKDATAKYLTWDQAPEAVKLELNTLEDNIFSNSQTPNISFDKLKGIGNPSGVALKLMFLDATLKALDKIETFGPALSRRINIIKGFIAAMDNNLSDACDALEIEPVITPFMPSNEKDLIDFLTTGTGGKAVMSRKTAVKLAGQVTDIDAEVKAIQDEESASLANPTNP